MVIKLWFYKLVTPLMCGVILLLPFSFVGYASADSSTLIGMVNSGDIYVKSGSVTAPWSTRLTTGEDATQLTMYGDRVAFVDGNNNLWLKQGLTSQWYEEMGNVQSYALTENGLLVLQSGGNVWYKDGSSPTAQWDSNLIANDGAKVYLSPGQMVIIDTSGNLLGKVLTPKIYSPEGWGPASNWLPIAQSVSSAALNDSFMVYIDSQGNLFAKPGSIDATTVSSYGTGMGLAYQASQAAVSGNTFCWIAQTDGYLFCKPALSTNLEELSMIVWGTNTNSYSMSPGIFVVNGNNGDGNEDLYGINYSQFGYGNPSGYVLTHASGWQVLSSTGSEITTNQE